MYFCLGVNKVLVLVLVLVIKTLVGSISNGNMYRIVFFYYKLKFDCGKS